MKNNSILIVGCDSFIGQALRNNLIQKKVNVCGTSRRRSDLAPDTVYLNLTDSPSCWRWPKKVGYAVISAGVTDIMLCQQQPEKTKVTNVTAIKLLIDTLLEKKIYTLFLSTNLVFDGKDPLPTTDTKTSPTTVYAEQKVEIEQHILAKSLPSSILRLPKIIQGKLPIVSQWETDVTHGRAIHPFKDYVTTFVHLDQLLLLINILLTEKATGLFHFSPREEISFSDLAEKWAEGRDQQVRIQPRLSSEIPGYHILARTHATLNSERINKQLNIHALPLPQLLPIAIGA